MTRPLSRRTFAGAAVGIPGLAALYACTPSSDPPPSPTANVAITEPQTGGGAAATEAPAADTSAPTLEVGMHDLYFEPADFSIPPDTNVNIKAVNYGALPHNWAVEGQSGLATPIDDGGTEHTITVNLPAGTYNVLCEVPGHAQAGMVGVLTVDPSAQLPAGGGGGEATPEGGTPGAGTPEAGAAAGAAAGTATTVSMVEMKFEPADLTIPANTDYTVTVVNNGVLPHYWAIEGTDLASPETPGGDTTPHDVVVNLAAGSYTVFCPVPGHRQAGMVGTLTVQ